MPFSSPLRILRCAACGALDAGPREICPICAGTDLEPHDVEGAGTLVSWTIIRRPPSRFRHDGAYCVAVVDLDANVRMTVRLDYSEATARPGARVALIKQDDGVATFGCVETALASGQ